MPTKQVEHVDLRLADEIPYLVVPGGREGLLEL